MIELIRKGKVEEALEFAQEELAPRGEENVAYYFSYAALHLPISAHSASSSVYLRSTVSYTVVLTRPVSV